MERMKMKKGENIKIKKDEKGLRLERRNEDEEVIEKKMKIESERMKK